MASGTFSRILRGYLGVLKGVGFLLVLLAGSTGLGFLVAYPLWLFSTSRRAAYSWFVIGVAAAAACAIAVRAGLRRKGLPAGPGARRKRPLIRILLGAVWVLSFGVGIYLVALLAARGLFAAAVPALAALLLLIGYLAFGRRRGSP